MEAYQKLQELEEILEDLAKENVCTLCPVTEEQSSLCEACELVYLEERFKKAYEKLKELKKALVQEEKRAGMRTNFLVALGGRLYRVRFIEALMKDERIIIRLCLTPAGIPEIFALKELKVVNVDITGKVLEQLKAREAI